MNRTLQTLRLLSFAVFVFSNSLPAGAQSTTEKAIAEIDKLLALPSSAAAPIASEINQKLLVKVTNKRRLKELSGVEIEISNNSDKAVIVDGTSALLQGVRPEKIKCASMKEIGYCVSAPDSPRHQYFRDLREGVEAFGSIGSIPTVIDQNRNNGPIPKRYGFDEARREAELGRLEKRVLYPGQQSSAFVYFKTKKFPASGASIEIPVSDLNNESDVANLVVPL